MAIQKKSVRYYPFEEEKVLDELGSFGWSISNRNEVYQSQEVFDSAYTIGYGNVSTTTVNTTTVTTNYISALFERDSDRIENFSEIDSLGKRYDYLESQLSTYFSSKATWKMPMGKRIPGKIFLLAIGIALVVTSALPFGLTGLGSLYLAPFLVFGLVLLFGGIAMLIPGIIGVKKYKENKEGTLKLLDSEILKARKEQIELVAKAKKTFKAKEIKAPEPAPIPALAKATAQIEVPVIDATEGGAPRGKADRLKELKEMLDEGLISQEEYDETRKDILRS